MILIPKPYASSFNDEEYRGLFMNKVFIDDAFSKIFLYLTEEFPGITKDNNASIKFIYKELLDEEYEIVITLEEIKVYASSDHGAFNAVQTLKIMKMNKHLLTGYIRDLPALKVRGVMLDISRTKVPTLKSLFELVDFFSLLKYNHLELYVEGFSYEFKSLRGYLTNYISVDECIELEKYCEMRFIDLVPNCNGFGHMQDFLSLDEFMDLSESESGCVIWGARRKPTTLNPMLDESYNLVKRLYDDMLPNFKSNYFNMNFDEPFELGLGKSKELCDNLGVGVVFAKWFNRLYDVVKSYNKTPLLWCDVLLNQKDGISLMPKDAIFIDWGYNYSHPFLENVKRLTNLGVSYMSAPGTISWASLLGKKIDMIGSIKNASIASKINGLGMIVTDWGDFGHLQYLSVSLLPFVYASMCAWGEDDYQMALDFLSIYLGNDSLVKIIDELSTYTTLEGEYRDYGSRLFSMVLWAEYAQNANNKEELFISKMQYNLIENESLFIMTKFFESKENELKNLLNNESNEGNILIINEYLNTIYLLKIFINIFYKLNSYYQDDTKQFIQFDEEIKSLESYLKVHKVLWSKRNKISGYAYSSLRITWLINILKKI